VSALRVPTVSDLRVATGRAWRLALLVLVVAATAPGRPALAQQDQQQTVNAALATVERMKGDSNFQQGFQPKLNEARAVVIVPALYKGGFILGGQYGNGVLLARLPDNSWSFPAFYTLQGGSFGLQIGLESASILFLIMTDKGLNAILNNQFKFGADTGVTFLVVGAGLGASTTSNLGADIYAFSLSGVGLYGGLSLEGTVLSARESWNAAYYGSNVASRAIVRVAPFKPQHRSNHAAVAADGGELGRAQALQARAAGVPSSRHMTPVLLKPQSERGAQVILQGRLLTHSLAADYQRLKPTLLPRVLDSFAEVGRDRDLVLVEGAGSTAEVNLRQGDIANMGFADAADLPVALVGDIERGGVIAALVGTHLLLPDAEQRRIKGFIINKFRGDPRLFDDGLRLIAARTGWVALGVIPWFAAASALPAEDSLTAGDGRKPGAALRIVVPMLPWISNADDFDPLAAEPAVDLQFVPPGQPLPQDADLIILPGSKATLADLAFFRQQGWDIDLLAHHRRGGLTLGICGGYQLLGRQISDPLGLEGTPGSAAGLGLLAVDTVLAGDKTVRASEGVCCGAAVTGYEIHLGRSDGEDCRRPFLELGGRPDGAVSADGRVMGGYLHDLFASDDFRRVFLRRLQPDFRSDLVMEQRVERTLDSLAGHLETHLDLDLLWQWAQARSGD
jgi:adenosylcobyric acid synthase